jgi:hypothetical protein
MATIEERKTKRGETRYRVLIRLRGAPPQSATFRRRRDAKAWALQTESAIRERETSPSPWQPPISCLPPSKPSSCCGDSRPRSGSS